MRYTDRDKIIILEPIDTLIEKLEKPLNTRTLQDALLPFLRGLDMKAQAAFDHTVRNEKVITSMDDDLAQMSEENEELRDALRKQFWATPNPQNKQEQSAAYQQQQGLDARPAAIKPKVFEEDLDDVDGQFFSFDTAEDVENFKQAMDCLMQITPLADPELVYSSLFLD